jgi:undecaprenyl-diphosphatase
MELIKSAIIAVVQGITEFLPVSSSGHILLFKYLLQLNMAAIFDVVVHVGTLGAVIIFYRRELWQLMSGLFQKSLPDSLFGPLTRSGVLKVWLLFIVATIPAGIVGLFLDDYLDLSPGMLKPGHLWLVAASFTITIVLLISTLVIKPRKEPEKIAQMPAQRGIVTALVIGCFQALAILPGVSRSGSTIAAALGLGVSREDAGRFSFILSIPLILAAFLLKVYKLMRDGINVDTLNIGVLVTGFIVAFVTGLLSLIILLKMIKKGNFWVFSIYLVIPVIISLIISFTMSE